MPHGIAEKSSSACPVFAVLLDFLWLQGVFQAGDHVRSLPWIFSLNQPDLERFVQEKVSSGQYSSLNAVVENALATLRLHEGILPFGGELERLIAEGQQQADRGEMVDGEEAFRRILSRQLRRSGKK